MTLRGSLSLTLLLAIVSLAVQAQEPKSNPTAKPEEVGFSTDRLQKIHDVVQQHIEAGDTPGVITLVSRNGRIAFWDAQGIVDTQSKMPMQKDTIFWVASMTKPLVATSVMMMVEAGKVKLSDPISKFIPEFRDVPQQVRVLKPGSPEPPPPGKPNPNAPKPEYDLIPATREITVKDLLTHTSGIQALGVPNDAAPPIKMGETLATWVPKWAPVPREFQPGSKWMYSNAAGFDVLARIVEVASGQPYDQFMQQRIFDPLGMKDSSFGPRENLKSRTMPPATAFADNPCVMGTGFFCGSAGLWTSAGDYWRFGQMLLNKGEFNGKRLVKAQSVDLMSSNQSGTLYSGMGGISGKGAGMGLSMVEVNDPDAAGVSVPPGSYTWDGMGTRRFWVIPAEKMVLIMLIPSGNAVKVQRDIEKTTMESLQTK